MKNKQPLCNTLQLFNLSKKNNTSLEFKFNAAYYGFFNPPTEAHIEIIKQIARQKDKLFIVINNDNRKKIYFPLQERINLLKQSIPQDLQKKIKFLYQNDNEKIDYFELKNKYKGKLSIIAGQDSFEKWAKYASGDSLKKYDEIIVIPRGNSLITDDIKNIPNVTIFKIDERFKNVSSTNVRKKLGLK